MIPHSIRLREPWESTPGSGGSATHRRRFNLPTNLDPWERVSLEVDRTLCAGQVTLNGTPLGQLTPGRFFSADVTAVLKPNNELSVTTQHPHPSPPQAEEGAAAGSPIGDVRLVIRAVHNP